MRLSAAVVFVSDLERAREFYCELLQLDVAISAPDALLLTNADGDHLIVREFARAVQPSVALGVRYTVWSATDAADLARCEQLLVTWGARVASWTEHGTSVVEGYDPDRTPILITYPPGPPLGGTDVPKRAFTY